MNKNKKIPKTKRFCLLCVVALLTFTSLGITKQTTNTTTAEAVDYSKVTLAMQMATGYQDALVEAGSDSSDYDVLLENINHLVNKGNFGSIGLILGPYSNTENVNIFSAAYTTASISADEITAIDNKTEDKGLGKAASEYIKFGQAVHHLKARGEKFTAEDAELESAANAMAESAMSIATIGIDFIYKFNPAPIVSAFFDISVLDNYEVDAEGKYTNKLVELVNKHEEVRGFIEIFGQDTRLGSSVDKPISLSVLIGLILIIGLIITAVLMTLINGRSAGENYRKAIVKVIIISVSIPILSLGINKGLDTVKDIIDETVTDISEAESNTHLLFSLWATTGFQVPNDVTIEINSNGQFVFTPDDVVKINKLSIEKTLGKSLTEKEIATLVKFYGNNNESNSNVFASVVAMDGDAPYKTKQYLKVAQTLGENNSIASDITHGIGYIDDVTNIFKNNAVTHDGSDKEFGISPIATANLLRTSFTSAGMTIENTSTISIPNVVYYAASNTSGQGSGLNPITNLILIYTMMIATLTGMFQILSAGFGGFLSGGFKSSMGSSSGFGQAVGGAIALTFGIFGISMLFIVIYNVFTPSMEIINDIIEKAIGSGMDGVLSPVLKVVEKTPFVGGLIAVSIVSFTDLIMNVLALLAIPKFASVPIKLFTQWISGLPSVFAERAQMIENRITGDFHGGGRGGVGGGGHGGMTSAQGMLTQAARETGAAGKGVLSGLGTMSGAVAGYGLSKGGGILADRFGSESSMSGGTPNLSGGTPKNDGGHGNNINKNPTKDGAEEPNGLSNHEPLQTEYDEETGEMKLSETPDGTPDGENDMSSDVSGDAGANTNVDTGDDSVGAPGEVDQPSLNFDDNVNLDNTNLDDSANLDNANLDENNVSLGGNDDVPVETNAFDSQNVDDSNPEKPTNVDSVKSFGGETETDSKSTTDGTSINSAKPLGADGTKTSSTGGTSTENSDTPLGRDGTKTPSTDAQPVDGSMSQQERDVDSTAKKQSDSPQTVNPQSHGANEQQKRDASTSINTPTGDKRQSNNTKQDQQKSQQPITDRQARRNKKIAALGKAMVAAGGNRSAGETARLFTAGAVRAVGSASGIKAVDEFTQNNRERTRQAIQRERSAKNGIDPNRYIPKKKPQTSTKPETAQNNTNNRRNYRSDVDDLRRMDDLRRVDDLRRRNDEYQRQADRQRRKRGKK